MTTRQLYVMRHGKSDWTSPSAGDHDRPLKKRGREAARTVGEVLAKAAQAPQAVLSSSAVRALDTARRAADAGDWPVQIEVDRSLYLASTDAVRARVALVSDDVERLMVVGHEPTSSLLVAELAGGAPPRFPTAAVARIDLELASWADVCGPVKGRLVWLLPPRLIQAALG